MPNLSQIAREARSPSLPAPSFISPIWHFPLFSSFIWDSGLPFPWVHHLPPNKSYHPLASSSGLPCRKEAGEDVCDDMMVDGHKLLYQQWSLSRLGVILCGGQDRKTVLILSVLRFREAETCLKSQCWLKPTGPILVPSIFSAVLCFSNNKVLVNI